jgi:hypothetical protein
VICGAHGGLQPLPGLKDRAITCCERTNRSETKLTAGRSFLDSEMNGWFAGHFVRDESYKVLWGLGISAADTLPRRTLTLGTIGLHF